MFRKSVDGNGMNVYTVFHNLDSREVDVTLDAPWNPIYIVLDEMSVAIYSPTDIRGTRVTVKLKESKRRR